VPQLLRAIRKSRWNRTNCPWLALGEIQSDLLSDFETKNNTLSVWLIQDDQSNLNEVVLALAINRDTISNFDYTIFDIDLMEILNIKLEVNEGNTPYNRANSWHRDLVELTINKIIKLAESLLEDAEKVRISEKKIANLIQVAVNNSQIDREILKPSISKKLL